MGTVNEGINKLAFILIVILLLVYFVGFSTDVGSVSSAINSLIRSILPLNKQGNYAGYPSAASKSAQQQNVPPAARNG